MLKDKVTLVIGASRGIGKAIALAFANEGATVVITYNSKENEAKETVEAMQSMGVTAGYYKCDISNFDDTKKLIENVIKEYGTIDVLVNNAGITKDNLIVRMSEAEFDDVVSTNLKGAFNTIKHISRYMMRNKSGSIVNVSSVVGLMGNIGQINYAAAKSGLIGLTKTTAKELAKYGVRCNAIAPGFIDTDMTNKLPEQAKEKLMKELPLNRVGTPEEVANVVTFLASDKSSYVTGEIIKVDGGMYI